MYRSPTQMFLHQNGELIIVGELEEIDHRLTQLVNRPKGLPYGGFRSHGGTAKSSILWDVPWNTPSSYWGTPILGHLHIVHHRVFTTTQNPRVWTACLRSIRKPPPQRRGEITMIVGNYTIAMTFCTTSVKIQETLNILLITYYNYNHI